MAMTKVFAPQYYEKFKCLGSNCSCDCCHDLIIKVDEPSFDKYSSLEDGRLRDKLLKKIEVTEEDPFSASISLNINGNCPFLKRNGLCQMQLKLDHENLPYPCRTYPRLYCSVGDKLETYMSMGCEAVAGIALFDEECMNLFDIQLENEIINRNILEPSKYSASKNALDMFSQLRSISVSILQLRKHKLWLRVIMLGFFIELAGNHLAEGNDDIFTGRVKDYVNSLADNYDDGEYRNLVADWHELKIPLIFKLFERIAYIRQEKPRDEINTCISQMKEGLGVANEELPEQELCKNFTNARDLYYLPFFEAREHILENYMVNAVLATGFPFTYGSEKSIYDNYVKLAIEYSMIKFLLVGMAGYHKENFGQAVIIKAVASISRLFDHSRAFTDAVADIFKRNDRTDMRTICVLAKD